jgi:hypothetical protein
MRDPTPLDSKQLPPWESHDELDIHAMINWSIGALIALDPHKEDLIWVETPDVARRRQLEDAKTAARNGDPTLLRKLYPDIADFIHPHKRNQGLRKSYLPKGWNCWTDGVDKMLLEMAMEDVRLLRTVVWPKHYGRSKRRTQPSAEEIVAVRYGLTVDQVHHAIRARSRRRRRV